MGVRMQNQSRKRKAGERAFLARYDPARYPRQAVAVDVILLTVEEGELRVLLVRRDEHPCRGTWALPGGFVGVDESVGDTAVRVLDRKVGLKGVFLEQLYTFSGPNRDPRMRVISVANMALVPASVLRSCERRCDGDVVSLARVRASWKGEEGGEADALGDQGARLSLAFDHAAMLGMALKRVRGRVSYTPVAYEFLPREFTLRDLQCVHEAVLGRELNKDSFRRRVLDSGELQATGTRESGVGHRPAELYVWTGAGKAH